MSEAEAHNALVQLIRANQPNTCFEAEVVSVDHEDHTCEVKPLDDRANLTGVRIRPEQDASTSGVYAIPKTGTRVLVATLDKGASGACVLSVADPDKVVIKTDDNRFIEVNSAGEIISKGDWVFNGGENGGVPTSQSLSTAFNALESKVNQIIAGIQAAPVVTGDGGASFKASLVTAAGGQLTLTVKTTLENTQVKH